MTGVQTCALPIFITDANKQEHLKDPSNTEILVTVKPDADVPYRLAAGNDFAHKLIGLGQTIGPAFADFAPGRAPVSYTHLPAERQ